MEDKKSRFPEEAEELENMTVSAAEDQKEAGTEAEETENDLDEGLPPGRRGLPMGQFLLEALSGFLLSVLVGAGFAALFLR